VVVLQCRDSTLLVQKLAESRIVASNRHDGLRISFHVYNTMDDVKAVAEVLKKNTNLLVLDPDPASVGSYD
jgi:selenocysteine lyase/cysteine desulfurase